MDRHCCAAHARFGPRLTLAIRIAALALAMSTSAVAQEVWVGEARSAT
jgi:hypothetical protein